VRARLGEDLRLEPDLGKVKRVLDELGRHSRRLQCVSSSHASTVHAQKAHAAEGDIAERACGQVRRAGRERIRWSRVHPEKRRVKGRTGKRVKTRRQARRFDLDNETEEHSKQIGARLRQNSAPPSRWPRVRDQCVPQQGHPTIYPATKTSSILFAHLSTQSSVALESDVTLLWTRISGSRAVLVKQRFTITEWDGFESLSLAQVISTDRNPQRDVIPYLGSNGRVA
jgi:hypothetical protein